MKLRTIVVSFVLALAPGAAYAQTVIAKPGALLAWDQPVVVGDAILPPAYTYTVLVDGQPAAAQAVTCTAPQAEGAPWTCQTPLPALTTGQHTITVVALVTVNDTEYATPEADPITVVNIVIQVPTNLRITEAGGA